MDDLDVTSAMDFDNPDDEYLPVTKCVCGKKFNAWNFMISIYRDEPTECPDCGRRFYFRNAIHIYQVEE